MNANITDTQHYYCTVHTVVWYGSTQTNIYSISLVAYILVDIDRMFNNDWCQDLGHILVYMYIYYDTVE